MAIVNTFVWETGVEDTDGDIGFPNVTATYDVTYNDTVELDDVGNDGHS